MSQYKIVPKERIITKQTLEVEVVESKNCSTGVDVLINGWILVSVTESGNIYLGTHVDQDGEGQLRVDLGAVSK